MEGCQVMHRFDEELLDTIYLVAITQSFVLYSTYLFLDMLARNPTSEISARNDIPEGIGRAALATIRSSVGFDQRILCQTWAFD